MSKSIIAAFDFDKTITTKDTLIPYLEFIFGKKTVYSLLFSMTLQFALYAIGIGTRQSLKEAMLTKLLKGSSYGVLKTKGIEFSHQILPQILQKEVCERVNWHKQQGHQCILVTAAVDLYAEACGKALGFDEVICSKCEIDQNHLLTGKLAGENCRALEKVKRLTELLGPKDGYTLYAYGDSAGDAEMLAIADYPFYQYGSANDRN